MDDYTFFDSPCLSVDKASLLIKFKPLIERDSAYHWLKSLGLLNSNRFVDGDPADIDTDWCPLVLDVLQQAIEDDNEVFGIDSNFKPNSYYNATCMLPIGVHLSMGKNKNARLIDRIEHLGPYQQGKPVRYWSKYETFDCDSQIRLEYNPNNSSLDLLRPFLSLLSKAPGFDPLTDIVISRIDWAVDLPYAVDMMLLTSAHSITQETISDKMGGVTKYIGSRKGSDNYIRLYDKKKQLKKMKKIEHPNSEFFRFEAVNKKVFELGDTEGALNNLFTKIMMLSKERLENNNDLSSTGLLISAYYDISVLSDCHFDAVVDDKMRLCERKKKWRLKKKFREYEKSTLDHPSQIFALHRKQVWNVFKKNILLNFRKK